MSYENLPATKLLATRCAVCRRPLVDAESVELGMGPECRKRHGFELEVSEEVRSEVNALVYRIALWRSTQGRQLVMGRPKPPTLLEVIEAVNIIRMRGFTRLADVLEKRLVTVTVTYRSNDIFVVDAPYSETFVALARTAHGRWESARKVWTFHVTERVPVYRLLRRAFPSTLGKGAHGLFALEPLTPTPM